MLPGGLLLDLGHPDGLFAVVVEGRPPVEGERERVVAFGEAFEGTPDLPGLRRVALLAQWAVVKPWALDSTEDAVYQEPPLPAPPRSRVRGFICAVTAIALVTLTAATSPSDADTRTAADPAAVVREWNAIATDTIKTSLGPRPSGRSHGARRLDRPSPMGSLRSHPTARRGPPTTTP
jgi:hypothetical protein